MSVEADFSEAVLEKARRVPAEDIRPHETDPTVWFVRSSRTGAEHRVQFVESWALCTCRRGDVKVSQAGCYHQAAAMLAAKDEAEVE